MRAARRLIVLALMATLCLTTACGGSAATRTVAASARAAAGPGRLAVWTHGRHVQDILDLAGPRVRGAFAIAAAGRLGTLGAGGGVRAFAPAYVASPGLEPYIVMSSGQRVPGAGCSFRRGSIYALRLSGGDGVTVISPSGATRGFASLPSAGLEDGIAFDTTGRFGHRLLVTRTLSGHTTVAAIDCRGRVRVLTRDAPQVEGGLAVAPRSFGRFGGDLIAPDELSGLLWAIAPNGRATLVARSGLPFGQDIGIESEGFVPAAFRDALVADRHEPSNPHPGDNVILRLSRGALRAVGVRAGDLLVVAEGGGATIAVRCGPRACWVRRVVRGTAIAHIEGHVVFSATL